jgi:hypothetical protein
VSHESLEELLNQKIIQLKTKVTKMRDDFDELEQEVIKIFKTGMANLRRHKEENLGKLESLLWGLQTRLKELRWMEYFNKFQIDFIGPEEYVRKYLVHQDMQKKFYSSLGLGKSAFINERHSEFVVRGQIDLVSTFRSTVAAVPKD